MKASLAALVFVTASVVGLRSVGTGTTHVVVAAAHARATTTVVSHGMRITMVVLPIQPLPRSALLRLSVRVTTVSTHRLQLSRRCDRANPRAVVGNDDGVEVHTTVHTFLLPTWTAISRMQPVARIPAPCPRPRLWALAGKDNRWESYWWALAIFAPLPACCPRWQWGASISASTDSTFGGGHHMREGWG